MATTLVLEGSSLAWKGKFRYYLAQRGLHHPYFREGESKLFESSPTWFDLAYKAIEAAKNMGFEVVDPDNYLDAEENGDDDAVPEVVTAPFPPPVSVPERPPSSITLTVAKSIHNTICGRDDTMPLMTPRYFLRGSSSLMVYNESTRFTTASDLITAALALGFLIDDPLGLLDKELEEENS